MNFLSTLYYHLRYNHPLLYFVTLAFAVVLLVTNVLSLTATTGVLDAIGATETGNRVVAAKEAIFWSYRAWSNSHDYAEIKPKRVYGYIQSTNRDGTVNLQIIVHNEYQTIRATLADLQITNPNGLAAIFAMDKQIAVDIDLYNLPTDGSESAIPSAVIWIDTRPINIDLITASVAIPQKTPPTNIVDRAFAEYNWKLALNKR